MKNSYPDSLIALTAAVTQACLLHINKNDTPVAYMTTKGSTTLQHQNISSCINGSSWRSYALLVLSITTCWANAGYDC